MIMTLYPCGEAKGWWGALPKEAAFADLTCNDLEGELLADLKGTKRSPPSGPFILALAEGRA